LSIALTAVAPHCAGSQCWSDAALVSGDISALTDQQLENPAPARGAVGGWPDWGGRVGGGRPLHQLERPTRSAVVILSLQLNELTVVVNWNAERKGYDLSTGGSG